MAYVFSSLSTARFRITHRKSSPEVYVKSISVQVISKCRRRRSRQRYIKTPLNTPFRPIQESIYSRSFPVYSRNRNNDRTGWNVHPMVKTDDCTNYFNLNNRGTLCPGSRARRPVVPTFSVHRICRNGDSKYRSLAGTTNSK